MLQTSSCSVTDQAPPGNMRFPRPSVSACASSQSSPSAPSPEPTLIPLVMTHSLWFTHTLMHGCEWGRAHAISSLLTVNVTQEHRHGYLQPHTPRLVITLTL